MDFRKTQHGIFLPSTIIVGRKVLSSLIMLCIYSFLSAQEISRDNITGNWTENVSWLDGTAPAVSGISEDVEILGTITRQGDLDFNNGDLTVHDTLLILGNLTLGNNSDLVIANGGVLIVYGDFLSFNQVNAITGGYFVVMGEFEQQGAQNQGSFEIAGGSVFISDPSPIVKTGTGFADLSCPDPDDYPANCGYGNESDLMNDPIYNLVNSGAFSITASGPLNICGSSGSVVLNVQDYGDSYQWNQDGNPVPGATSYQYTATTSGNYHVEVTANAFVFETDTITFSIHPLPVVSFDAISDVCENTSAFDLSQGIPAGGTYSGTGITTSPEFQPVVAGAGTHTLTYSYTDGNGCTNAALQSITVLSLSTEPLSALVDRDNICPGDGNIILSYSGGTLGAGAIAQWYSDAGFSTIVGSGNGLLLSAPAVTTTYYVRFEGTCDTTAAASVTLTVLPSPVPTISLNNISPVPTTSTSINLGYSATSGGPSLYSITWGVSAISAGFTNISDATLPASPILINIPSGIEAGQTYTATLHVKNVCNTSVDYPINISVLNTILGVGPHATVAYSLRKLSSTYSGPAVEVRRSSDNLKQDIGFDAAGNIDEAALLAFTGATNGYISVWYDQSGNGQNAIQGNTNYQPMLVENGIVLKIDGKPMLRFDGTNDLLNYSNPPANNFSIFTLARTSQTHEIDPESNSGTGGTSGQRYLLGAPHGGTDAGQGISIGTNGISNYEHGAGYMPATAVYSGSVTNLKQLNILYTNRRPRMYVDGLLVRTGVLSGRPTVTASTQIGSGTYGAFDGEMPELIIFPYSLSNADRQTIEFNQSCHYSLANLTLGDVSGITPDATTAYLNFTEGANQSWTYSIVWDATALSAGFADVTDLTLPASPVGIAVPAGMSEGDVYTGTFSATNSCGTTLPDHPITIKILNKILGLDSYSSSAYSLRKIASAYTGAAVRVRRSNDGELRDVYFDAEETLSLNSPVSSAGGGIPTSLTLGDWIGGNSATIRIWYDQSGNGKHANQSSTSAQPVLVLNGVLNTINTQPMIKFDGVNDLLTYSDPPENNFSIFTIAQTTSTHQIDAQSTSGAGGVGGQRYLMGAANMGEYFAGQGISLGTNGISNYEHGNGYMPATAVYSGSVTGLNLVDVLYSGMRPYIYLNGSLVRTGLVSPKSTVYASTQIGGMNYGYFNGNISEIIIFPYSVSVAERQQIECSQIEHYSIFGPVSASIDKNNICPGEGTITLSYSGGNLRPGATAEWYSDSALAVNVGSGNNISIPAPLIDTEYFVRFEGACNTSLPVSTSITVKESPVEPDTATVDRSVVCAADGYIVLSFSGGSPGVGGIARWYSDTAFSDLVGTGNDINLAAPTQTQTYYVRYEAECGDSPAAEVTVTVNPLPVVAFTGLDSIYDISDPIAPLFGNPVGGVFSGYGISGNDYNPSLAGVRIDTVIYSFTDSNGCTSSDTATTRVQNYDFREGARLIPSIDNWCSAEAIYTTIGATADELKAGCWPNGPNYNRWFKFQATTSELKIDVKTGGTEGILRRPMVALWDEAGNEIACQYYYSDFGDIISGSPSLNPGEWYYISVDNGVGLGYRGTFTLCLDDAVDYDFKEGAITLPHIPEWISPDAEYSTLQASADKQAGTCWPNGPNYNRWFKFQATSPFLTVEVGIGGTKGSMRRPMLALWDEADNQLACARYYTDYDNVKMGYSGLTPGTWYYFSVDNHQSGGYRGSFSLTVNNTVDYDFPAGAIELTDLSEWCSADQEFSTIAATADGERPVKWNSGPNYNRWFKFRATTGQIRAEMKTGGLLGTLRNGLIAIWDSAFNEVASARYLSEYSPVIVSSTNLIPGNLYYISVDNYQDLYRRGTFTLCVTDIVDYDFKEGAVELPSLSDWCSPQAIYTTIGGTPDGEKGTLWPNGPNYNRWFKFAATTNQVKIELRTGGDDGTLRYGMIALWDSAGNEIKSARYSSEFSHVVLSANILNPGEAYWISVDNHVGGGYRGTFSLCLNDVLDYDFREAAIELTDLNYWCSDAATYTTVGATADEEKGSTWNNGPNYNRWFKFQATKSTVKIDMKTGGIEGLLRYPFIALWDSTGNEIVSARYNSEYSDISVSSASLVPGNWYFISADNHVGNGYRGTFSLCITDTIDYDFKEAAFIINDIDDWCSANAQFTTIGATPDRLPGSNWNSGPNYNRWFKFQATGNQIKVDLKTGGSEGTLRYPYLAIWNEYDQEIASVRYTAEYSNIYAGSDSLTPGEWYYISVDNLIGTGYRGTFTLCITDTLDYDYKSAARIIPHSAWCSVQKEFSTIGATPDEEKGSIWPSGPNNNRWFKFQAVKPMVKVDMKTGGEDGTLQYPYLALWDSAGNEIASSRYYSQYHNISVSSINLVPGEWYYISADNHNNTGYRGSFTLCISDTVDYDYKEAAVIINSIDDWCSPQAAYTTLDATPDRLRASTWVNGPTYNRWFKFQATNNMVRVDLMTGGEEGTLQYPFLAIWNEDDIEVASARYIGAYDHITASSDTLTSGNWYYISADNHNSSTSYRGTFGLCVTDTLDYDYKIAAIHINDITNWCSEEAEFSTLRATPDEDKGSAWLSGPNNNRWFSFRASASGHVTAILKTGGSEGTIQYPFLALWDSAGNEILSARYSWQFDDISVGSSELNPGELYYISVDNHSNVGYRGTFSLCVKDTIDYDFRTGAIELPHTDNWCSDLLLYSTAGATPDGLAGSCWNSGPNYNRWFKFRATSEDITLRLLTGGSYGTLQYPFMALWDSAGNQIDCRTYTGQYNTLELTSNSYGLVVGELYYISVDNHSSISYRGSFSLCIDNKLSYDFKDGAFTIPNTTNWCSDLVQFSTLNATPDELRGTCLPNGPSYNRWFRFQATGNSISVLLRTTGLEGNLRRPFLTLWDESLNQVSCGIYSTDNSDVEVFSESLIPGEWYYISVDNWNNSAYRGNFTLCVTDQIVNDNISDAILLNDLNSWCSQDAQYTNSIATADESSASCWEGSENRNVWFSFIANSNLITIDVKTGGNFGQMSGQQIALWDDAGNEIDCTPPLAGQGDLTLVSGALVPGNLYYISVDDNIQPGTFTFCIEDDISYSYPEGALELTDLSNWCSPDAAFSNATSADYPLAGSCWSGTISNIMWFKFRATTPEIKATVTTGGAFGSMRNQQVALWNINGDEVACSRYVTSTGSIIMQSDSLIVGNWYWMGVDDNSTKGTFSICLDDEVDFDFRHRAQFIGDVSLWCSGDGAFSNQFATADQDMGSCWTGSVNENVWFSFVAGTPFIRIQVKTGSVYGTMQRQQVALFNSDGVELGCSRYTSNSGTIILQIDTLTIGNQYWISIDDDLTSGTFTICTDDSPDYDYRAGAREITNLNNWCSGNAVYSNFYATPDESMGSCWLGTENKNVWFRFQATTRFITATLKTGTIYGSMRRAQMTIWNEEGAEVSCKGPVVDQGTNNITIDSLTPGNWYYLSVDDNLTPGSFSLCFNDQPGYDYKEGAKTLLHNAGCSMDAEFSNFHATPDQAMGSCWSGSENKNVWFRFQATTPYLTLSLKNGGIYGSIRRAQIALWQEDGTEVKCVGRIIDQGTTILNADNLTMGDWYYISVDDDLTSGSFSLCIEDELSYDFKAGARLISDISNWCSPDAAYTNFFATEDEVMGSCWSGTENKNVWFRFQATTPFISIDLKTANVYGTMRRPQMALWNEAGTEIQCVGPVIYSGTQRINIDTLTPGNWYYLSVDDNTTPGSFSLCFDDQPNYDYREGAIILNHNQGCSPNLAYSNFFATPDQIMGSCWGGTENKNVWFMFQATTTYLTVKIRTGTVYGSMERPQIAVWTDAGTEVKCLGPIINTGTALLSIDNLNIGDFYYISVDDNRTPGSFTLCIEEELDYDYWEGAKILDHNTGCSSDAVYTNFYATDDEEMGPCWSGTENKNVWFRFQAISPYVTASLRTGNIYGNMRRGQMALWNEAKENIKCVGPVYDLGTNVMSYDSLTVGNWYWISIDDNYNSGSFTFCLSDEPDYDYKVGAITVPHTVWCSGDQEFTNAYATNDEVMAPCWSGSLNKNVWFKFQATGPFVTIETRTGTVEGTMRRAQIAVWNEEGALVKCVPDLINAGSTSLSIDSLSAGKWYYISVDDNNTAGTFTLCINNEVDYDYKAGAVEIVHDFGCYPELTFSNLLATPDGSQGSCWTGSTNRNVWFKFQAISPEVRAEIKTGTIFGSMRTAQATIWNDAGVEISCSRYAGAGIMVIQSDSLTPGNWYYISVDDDQTSGSFSLCIGDEVDNDFFVGALTLTDLSRWCSADGTYTNAQATPDGQQGSCWTGSQNKNVWFKFIAETKNVLVRVTTGSVYGNMRRQQIALWNEARTEIGCARLAGTSGILTVSADTLIPGNTYWISVDDDNTSGNFSLCIDGNPLDAIVSGTNISCGETSDGTISVLATGGTGSGYSYAWTKDGIPFPFTTPNITNLEAGTYVVTVSDAGDGTTVVRSYPIIQIPSLTISLSKTDETCPGSGDGSITALAGGGTSTAYLFTWTKDGVATTDVLPNLIDRQPGWYKVTVQDALELSCIESDSIQVLTSKDISVAPTGINISNNNICQGTTKTLTVIGGSLGTGASWKWYLDNTFTTSAGPDGSSLDVDPAVNTTYWVRAEGDCNITPADSGTVLSGISSQAPTSVAIDRNNICPGDGTITLTYSGGSLGDGALAQWYSDSLFSINIGDGNDLNIPAPLFSTTYFVRFEGDCNITSAVSESIIVKESPVEPVTADVDRDSVCPSDGSILLSYTGGSPGNGGIARWYYDAAFSALAGTGNNLSLPAPASTQTYYIRFEADCGNSAAVPVTITVNALPTVSLDPLDSLCLDEASFALSGGLPSGGSYSGTGVSSGIFSPATAGAGTHSITYTYTNIYGCTDSASQTLTVNVLPDPIISGPTESCLNESGVFSTTLNADHNYAWTVNGATTTGPADTNELTVEFGTPGPVSIQVTETNNITGCSRISAVYNVTVYDVPSIGEITSDNELLRR